ncbi:hypothetical protein JTB14_024200 [Gonioctena quinquepunctata]|nr:hypothetical protein JTB14_024200 [Gonioctena quinquepunctata]
MLHNTLLSRQKALKDTAHRMNSVSYLLIALVGFSTVASQLGDDDYGEEFLACTKEWHKKCVAITGNNQTSIDAVKKGNFDDNDEKMKRYILCLWFLSGYMDADMNYNKIVYETMPKKIQNAEKIYEECHEIAKQSEEVEKYEKLWALTKCIHARNPETFIMF